MRLFTSYFAMEKFIPEEFTQFSIALRTPPFFRGLDVRTFQPTWEMLAEYKKTGDEAKYIERYNREILGRLDPDQFWEDMEDSFGDRTVVFMCYERPNRFCHRHLVAKWFTDAGHPVEELEVRGEII